MKNIILKSLFLVLAIFFVSSCSEFENIDYEGESLVQFDKVEQTAFFDTKTNTGNNKLTYAVAKPVSSDHSIELVFDQSQSSAVLGTDFNITRGTDVLNGGDVFGDFEITITEAAANAGKTAFFTLKSNSLPVASFNNELVVKFSLCPSELAGTYSYSTVNYYNPDNGTLYTTPVTGSVTFGATGDNGIYSITDASFGGYTSYGATVTAKNVQLKDACGKLSFLGTNQYGDTFAISNVVVNGANLNFKWTTSYGEYGTTTLTRADGSSWPADLN